MNEKRRDFHPKQRCFSFLVVISVYNKTKFLPITFLREDLFPQEINV